MLTSCVICTVPRSGSWLLAEALNNTGLVGQPEEYFRPDHMHLWKRRWGLEPRSPYHRFIGAAIDYSTTRNGVFSVKMHWYQFEWFLEQLRELEGGAYDGTNGSLFAKWVPNPKYVLLLRQDKPRQAVSYWRAGRDNRWFVQAGEEAALTPDPEPELDVAAPDFDRIRWLERHLLEHERNWLAFFDEERMRPLTILYEHFVANYSATVIHILDWMGIRRPANLAVRPPGLKKQADEVTESILSEYMAVRDHL